MTESQPSDVEALTETSLDPEIESSPDALDAAPFQEQAPEDDPMAALREILLREERRRHQEEIQALQAEISRLEGQLADQDALVETIAPVLGTAIQRQIRESKEEMIEALYPIIGQLVMRAVTQAMRDLARSIDERLRTTFDKESLLRRFKAWITGVPEAELALREALPFQVQEIFLIHQPTGLLLWHASGEPEDMARSELISGMLTAIQDFATHALGDKNGEERLGELQYQERLILLEFGARAYVAVVVEGVPPLDFRPTLRQALLEFEAENRSLLANYQGNPSSLAGSAQEHFQSFIGHPALAQEQAPSA